MIRNFRESERFITTERVVNPQIDPWNFQILIREYARFIIYFSSVPCYHYAIIYWLYVSVVIYYEAFCHVLFKIVMVLPGCITSHYYHDYTDHTRGWNEDFINGRAEIQSRRLKLQFQGSCSPPTPKQCNKTKKQKIVIFDKKHLLHYDDPLLD